MYFATIVCLISEYNWLLKEIRELPDIKRPSDGLSLSLLAGGGYLSRVHNVTVWQMKKNPTCRQQETSNSKTVSCS